MKRHSTDLTSLIFGGIFLSIVAWWVVSHYIRISVPNFGWFAAGALIVIGVLGIAGSLRGERNREPVSAAPVPGGSTSSFASAPFSAGPTSFSAGPTSSSGSSFSSGPTTSGSSAFPGGTAPTSGTASTSDASSRDDDTLA